MVESTAEAEDRGMFQNRQTAVPLLIILYKLDFPQPPTPIKTDNYVAKVIITTTVRQKNIQGNGHAILLD